VPAGGQQDALGNCVSSNGGSAVSSTSHAWSSNSNSSSNSISVGHGNVQQAARLEAGCHQPVSPGAPAGAAARVAAAAAAASEISAQAAANFMWGVAQLQQQQCPSQEWLHHVVSHHAGQLPYWPGSSIAVFVWACAKLGYTQQQHQVQHQQQQQQQQHVKQHVEQQLVAALRQGRVTSQQDMAQVLWAAATMRLAPAVACSTASAAAAGCGAMWPQHCQQQHCPQRISAAVGVGGVMPGAAAPPGPSATAPLADLSAGQLYRR